MANRQPEIAGEYRDCPVSVGTHDQPSPAVVRMKVEELLQFRPATAAEAVRCHVAFETIHPFQDGNERTGRMSYLRRAEADITVFPVGSIAGDDVTGPHGRFDLSRCVDLCMVPPDSDDLKSRLCLVGLMWLRVFQHGPLS